MFLELFEAEINDITKRPLKVSNIRMRRTFMYKISSFKS